MFGVLKGWQGVAKLERLQKQRTEVSEVTKGFAWHAGVIAVLGAFAVAQPPTQQFASYKGKPVPDFVFQTIDGKKQRFSAYKGKVLVLNFWSPH